LSRYVDLLKQIPPGKEEISGNLLKQLNDAACNLLYNRAGQYDLTEEERREYADYEPLEVSDNGGRWGLLDKWPLQLGDLTILRRKDKKYWYLGICFGSNPYVILECGTKEEIFERTEKLNKYRETEGEEAFENKIMYLLDRHEEGLND
jgi:hypothetical protein